MVYTISEVSVMEKSDKKCCVWKEIVLAVLANLPFFTNGVETTMLTSSAHSGHFINYSDIQWTTTAMVVAAGVAAPLLCYTGDKFGRMTGVFIVSLVQGISLIPHFLLNNRNMYNVDIILHILAGISSGGLFTVIPIYVREITSIRGFSIAIMIVMTTAGYMTKMIVTEIRLYLMVALLVVQFLSMLMMVESPSYLVMMEKYESARRNLSKLKLLAEDDPNISKEISDLKDESDRAKSNGKLSIVSVWRNKIWLDGTKIGILLYTLTTICGSILFLDQQKTLMQLKVSADPENMLVVSSLFAGSVFCFICVTVVDRKYLLTLSYVVMALSTGLLAVYTQADLTVTSLRWLPVTALGVLVFAYGIEWGLPTVVMVEILNLKIRATLLGAIYAYSQIIKLIHILTFKYIEDYVGIYTTFYIFACINLYGVVYTLFAIPNLKNKSVRQIERQLKRTPLPA